MSKVIMALLLTVLMVMSGLATGCLRPVDEVVDPIEPLIRYGAWLDEIVGIVVDHDDAVPMIEAGKIDLFADVLADPDKFAGVVACPYMGYELRYWIFAELTFNPAGTPEYPTFHDGRLNPFAVPRIREAMNWLLCRTYVAEELWGGMAVPRYLPIHPAFPDYARLIDVARKLELYYAYNPERGRAIIFEEMEKLGAVFQDGYWYWEIDGVLERVEIIVLGRIEEPRKYLAHYVTGIMEGLGFKVKERLIDPRAARPGWRWPFFCPYDGFFHIHTGAWIAPAISRDQGGVFDFFYTPRGMPLPIWAQTKPSPEFDDLSKRLGLADYESLEERGAMMERALELAMEDSNRVFVVQSKGFMPRRADIRLASDLAAGIAGTYLWALTTRFECPDTGAILVGGTATVGVPDVLRDPWNPISGSARLFDMMFIRATMDWGTMPDPFTGLDHPQRIERAEVYVREGLPVGVTHDWLSLDFVPEPMEVPMNAWVDWCALEQRFITLAEACPEWAADRLTADVKVRIYYPADLWNTVKWHDGSPLDLADFVMGMLLGFDRANPDSPIFDPAAVGGHTAFMEHFRGVRIVSEDPLIIESYTNMIHLDAELIATDWTWFPFYDRGPGAWHNLTPAILAEMAKDLAFSAPRAAYLGVYWTSFIAGPSLPILERHLAEATAAGFIPYAPTLGAFITPEEAAAHYTNLQSWVKEKGHFWIGTGPFYLEAACLIEEIVHLKRFAYFPDLSEKWVGFAEARVAEVEVIGPTEVTAGDEATFDIKVTFQGEPYPVADVDFVPYFLVDALGEIVHVGSDNNELCGENGGR